GLRRFRSAIPVRHPGGFFLPKDLLRPLRVQPNQKSERPDLFSVGPALVIMPEPAQNVRGRSGVPACSGVLGPTPPDDGSRLPITGKGGAQHATPDILLPVRHAAVELWTIRVVLLIWRVEVPEPVRRCLPNDRVSVFINVE